MHYIDIKMHHLVTPEVKRISIIPSYDRNASVISTKEKDQKLFNWKRPTATQKEGGLVVHCFPGEDYIRHYAALISSHFAINDYPQPDITVHYPTVMETQAALSTTNIDRIKDFNHLTLGTVESFKNLRDTDWQDEDQDFLWASKEIAGQNTAVVGCKFSMWGDIGGEIACRFVANGNKNIVYTGKLGGMGPNQVPNQSLATGQASFVKGEQVVWDNPFAFITDENLHKGQHYSIYSPVAEHKDWLLQNQQYDFVDPEIGLMAKAVKEAGGSFGYLHIVSDNLNAIGHSQNLSNERHPDVRQKRKVLLENIEDFIIERIKRERAPKYYL